MLPSEGTLAAQPPAMHVTSASLPDRSSVAMPPTSASARSNMAACAPPVIAPTLPGAIPVSDAARKDAQQFWTASSSAPARTSPPRTISTGSSSIASSLDSSIYTPSTPASSTFDGAYQVQQPFLAVESAPTESYNTWQPETPGHLSDFSQWLQQSMQSSQACLASQEQTECPPGLGMSLDSEPASSFSYSSHWQSHNALGLENLFPSLGPGSTRMTLDPLQLLGRPLTPLYRLSSPSAEYTFAN